MSPRVAVCPAVCIIQREVVICHLEQMYLFYRWTWNQFYSRQVGRLTT